MTLKVTVKADGKLERFNNTMTAARGLGRSCRKPFYGFEGWQTAGLNALKTDDSEGKWQA